MNLAQFYEQNFKIYFKINNRRSSSRWEDEVKKEIPVPECLMKDSSKYTDEDIAVIEVYKAKVQVLQKQREKYKSMLQVEMAETKGQLRHSKEWIE